MLSIIYVVSQYPAISHTFILGEVNGLKSEGIEVSVASINKPDRDYEHLTVVEQAAYKETTFVKSSLLTRLPLYLMKALWRHPKGFFQSFGSALSAGFNNYKMFIQHIGYWLEAMVIADMAYQQGSCQLHAHFSSQGCTVAMLAAQMAGIDFSFTVHGPDEFYNVEQQQLPKKFAAANFIVCISDFARSQVMKFTEFKQWKKLHTNYLGVDPDLFYPTKKNNNIPILLCVGRLVNAKGQGVLVQAADILVKKNKEFVIQFVGDGPDRLSLETFVKERKLEKYIQFLGKVNHDQVQKLQREADVFVLPSFAEGIPVVLMEAMASGTPCVTTHITGIPELFTHQEDGLLVRPGNSKMLADALGELLHNQEYAESIACKALAKVRQYWNIHRSNQRLATLFKQQLEHL